MPLGVVTCTMFVKAEINDFWKIFSAAFEAEIVF